MTTESRELMERFPVRKSRARKEEFRAWLCEALTAAGWEPRVEEGKGMVKSHNVVVGDPETAGVVFTAHYDTPARLPTPNINFPYNMLVTMIAQMPIMLLIMVPALGLEILTIHFTQNSLLALLVVYVVLLASLWLLLAGPANPSNVNDNTSGIVTLLEIALSLPQEERADAAFIFFDNEELGLLGSSAFYKAHKKAMQGTLLVNFDCVSDGDHIRLFPGKKARKRADLLELLEGSFLSAGEKEVAVSPRGYYPSDQKHFPLGVGVCALRKGPFGYWLGKIHTARDTVFMEENIEVLRRGAVALAASRSAAMRGETPHEV